MSEQGDSAFVSWDDADARYHFIVDLPDLTPTKATGKTWPTLYKNPPYGTERGELGYFRCRYLDANAACNAALVNRATEIINREGMVAKVRAARAAELVRQEEEGARLLALVVRRQRFGSRGGALLDAISVFLSHVSAHGLDNPSTSDRIQDLRRAKQVAEAEAATPADKTIWEELS